MGWNIVKHAFGIVFGNLGSALRVTVGPIILAAIVIFAIASVFGVVVPGMSTMDPSVMMGSRGNGFIAVVVFIVIFVFLFAWIAVSWHRFVLLEEYPGLLPAISGRPIAAYAVKSLLLGLLLVALAIPFGIVMGMAMMPMGGGSGAIGVGIILSLIAGTVLSYFWFRIAVILPGIALGKPMTISEGWAATAALKGAIFNVAMILVGLNVILSVLLIPISAGMPLIAEAINLVGSWVTLMIGASILTTLYGHLVEGRDLVG